MNICEPGIRLSSTHRHLPICAEITVRAADPHKGKSKTEIRFGTRPGFTVTVVSYTRWMCKLYPYLSAVQFPLYSRYQIKGRLGGWRLWKSLSIHGARIAHDPSRYTGEIDEKYLNTDHTHQLFVMRLSNDRYSSVGYMDYQRARFPYLIIHSPDRMGTYVIAFALSAPRVIIGSLSVYQIFADTIIMATIDSDYLVINIANIVAVEDQDWDGKIHVAYEKAKGKYTVSGDGIIANKYVRFVSSASPMLHALRFPLLWGFKLAYDRYLEPSIATALGLRVSRDVAYEVTSTLIRTLPSLPPLP